jgi:hypothetical protein
VIIYLALFAVAILMVFRFMPYQIGLIIIPLALLFLDREALKQVDYGLLFTFVFFFIFAGNMGRIGAVRDFFSYLLNINTLVFSAMSCQFISNVPSAILLSQFTDNYRELLLGVNIGGAGTLIASLAIDCGVKVNILGADTRNIDGKAFGTMLLGLPDDPNEAAKALSYIKAQPNISAEEVEYRG